MVRRRPKLGLSRKIVAYYLFFCLAAVCWLAAGVVATSHALLGDRTANSCLSRFAKASAAIELHWLRHKEAGVDSLLTQLAGQCQAAYGAIVGVDGKSIAHTDEAQAGIAALEPVGTRTHWGEVTSVEYVDPHGRALQEYRVALSAGGHRLGELRMAVEEPSIVATIQATAHMAPLAVLAPVALVGAGAFVLSRLARSVAVIEGRLREVAKLPLGASVEVEPVPARDSVALGWNRIVDHLRTFDGKADVRNLDQLLEHAAQARSDARFEEILQRLSDGVAVTDASGRIAFANQAVSALLGQTDEDGLLCGALLEERLLESVASQDCELTDPAARQRTAVCELVQHQREAQRILRVARFPLGEGQSQSHVWSLRDVTQQKLAEQTRDRFIDTATHELRTPLSNIKAYAETLATAEYMDVELQKEFCNIINSEVTRLARFIDDLLSISSMEVGALTVDRQKVETERLFAEVLSKIEPLMQKKDITFDASLPPRMPELHLDKDKIISVIVNILGNAAKYTPVGGRVSMKVKVEDGVLRIAVQDSGVGIAPDELPKVFDKFFRSDDPRVQAETGTGLGLSLVREVVHMHGGEIGVESVLNQGSTFTVSLPLH